MAKKYTGMNGTMIMRSQLDIKTANSYEDLTSLSNDTKVILWNLDRLFLTTAISR